MSKYARLSDHLRDMKVGHWRVSFTDLEQILGFALPQSARQYPAWWANQPTGAQCQSWLGAGWKTKELDLGLGRVTFVRTDGARQIIEKSPAVISAPVSSEVFAPLRINLTLQWRPQGQILLDASGKLDFPAVMPRPGLYRIRICSSHGERRYIGESDNLQRRWQHYRTPGPTQETNLRMNSVMREALSSDSTLHADTMLTATTTDGAGSETRLDLSDKATRRLVENAALVFGEANTVELLNR